VGKQASRMQPGWVVGCSGFGQDEPYAPYIRVPSNTAQGMSRGDHHRKSEETRAYFGVSTIGSRTRHDHRRRSRGRGRGQHDQAQDGTEREYSAHSEKKQQRQDKHTGVRPTSTNAWAPLANADGSSHATSEWGDAKEWFRTRETPLLACRKILQRRFGWGDATYI
jgi:hypothetical protein